MPRYGPHSPTFLTAVGSCGSLGNNTSSPITRATSQVCASVTLTHQNPSSRVFAMATTLPPHVKPPPRVRGPRRPGHLEHGRAEGVAVLERYTGPGPLDRPRRRRPRPPRARPGPGRGGGAGRCASEADDDAQCGRAEARVVALEGVELGGLAHVCHVSAVSLSVPLAWALGGLGHEGEVVARVGASAGASLVGSRACGPAPRVAL
jgi:hypothetical protein